MNDIQNYFRVLIRCLKTILTGNQSRKIGTPTEPGTTEPGTTKPGTSKTGTTVFGYDQGQNDQAWNNQTSNGTMPIML
jgi:hypothetical protein